MNWNDIKKFCFTYAMPGGAWLEDGAGRKDWFPRSIIVQKLGELWFNRMLQKQGWMTGCWVNVN